MHSAWRVRYRLLIGVALVSTAVAGTAFGGSGASQVGRFVSKRYGFSVVAPAGWVVYPATSSVSANSAYLPIADSPQADSFRAPGTDGGVIGITRTKVGRALTLKTWASGTPKRFEILIGCKPKGPRIGKIATEPAAIFTLAATCPGGPAYAAVDYAVAHNGYGYDIQLVSLPKNQARDVNDFEQMLKTFKFSR
jgi:hypothetical protein